MTFIQDPDALEDAQVLYEAHCIKQDPDRLKSAIEAFRSQNAELERFCKALELDCLLEDKEVGGE